jgi:hypothetical protein
VSSIRTLINFDLVMSTWYIVELGQLGISLEFYTYVHVSCSMLASMVTSSHDLLDYIQSFNIRCHFKKIYLSLHKL